jgi:hypothetical protein
MGEDAVVHSEVGDQAVGGGELDALDRLTRISGKRGRGGTRNCHRNLPDLGA